MRWTKPTTYTDMTLPVGSYGCVIQKLQDGYPDDWIAVGDIVFQARSFCHEFATEIFNVTRGIAGYSNNTHWRQSKLARQPYILIQILDK